MALLVCRECGREVSDEAKICPHCGVRRPAARSWAGRLGCLGWGGIIFAVLWVVGSLMMQVFPDRPGPSDLLSTAPRAVRAVLNDPESARFGWITVHPVPRPSSGDTVFGACGTVNARNAFGGYTGEVRFATLGTAETTVLESAVEPSVWAAWRQKVCDGPVVAAK